MCVYDLGHARLPGLEEETVHVGELHLRACMFTSMMAVVLVVVVVW
jgi:aspartyl aminopeptidase